MILKKTIATILFLLFSIVEVLAQAGFTSSGGEFRGASGHINYSLGQLAFTTISNSSGSVSAGVQQPFIISTISSIENESVELESMAFPNPTSNNLTLRVNNVNSFTFQVFDMKGNVLLSDTVNESIVRIDMKEFPSAMYFLKVLSTGKTLKTFKIIKN